MQGEGERRSPMKGEAKQQEEDRGDAWAVHLDSPTQISGAGDGEGLSFQASTGDEDDFEFAVADSGDAAEEAFPVFGRAAELRALAMEVGGEEKRRDQAVPEIRARATEIWGENRRDLVAPELRVRATEIWGEKRRDLAAPVSASSSEDDEVDDLPAGVYCAWPPAAARRRSASTGSESRRLCLRDVIVGRSASDGSEQFHFLKAPPAPPLPAAGSKKEKKGGKVTEIDMATAHRLFYAPKKAAGGEGGGGVTGGRRSYLPYRRQIVGLFANPYQQHHWG